MFKKLFLSLSLLILSSLPLLASTLEFSNSVARIESPSGQGSGFFVRPDRVITARHVADLIASENARGWYVYDSAGDKHRVMKVLPSYDADIAILLVDKPKENAPVAEISCRVPAILETLLAVGHPTPYKDIFSPMMVVGYSDARDIDDALSLVMAGAASGGMSGGPLFDKKGKVIGVISNSWRGEVGLLPFTNVVPFSATELCEKQPRPEAPAPAADETNHPVPPRETPPEEAPAK
jgi:S1-C subfamily serine protease